MDAMEALVEGPRARGALVLRLELDGDWAISVEDESMLTVMAVLAGHCVVTTGTSRVHAHPGDVIIVRGPQPYAVSSDPDRTPDFIIPPSQVCIDVHGNRLVESMARGLRTWGTTDQGVDRLLVGTYMHPLEVGRLSAQLLPDLLVERTDATTRAFAELLAAQVGTNAPGQAVVLDRLLDTLLISALRAAGSGVAGGDDPPIDRVLDLIHAKPQSPMSVPAMARTAALSRAAFSQRFTHRTGLSPGAYQRRLRLAWAADTLLATTRTITSVATEAGYSSPAAFSTAFKHEHGQSPQGWRRHRHNPRQPEPADH